MTQDPVAKAVRKVLIIEDEPEIRLILDVTLRRLGGYDPILASDGIEGLALASAEMPDLILVDVMMPRLDGYSTCRKIKRNPDLQAIPIIFLTAKTAPSEIDRALRAGAAGCIAKPFDPLRLAEQVREIVEGVCEK